MIAGYKKLLEFEQQVHTKGQTENLCRPVQNQYKKYKSKTCAERGDLALAPLPGSKPERSQTRWRQDKC